MAAGDGTHLTPLFQSCRVWRTLSLLKYIYCVLVFSVHTLEYFWIVVMCKYRNWKNRNWVLEVENRTESNQRWNIQTDPAAENEEWQQSKRMQTRLNQNQELTGWLSGFRIRSTIFLAFLPLLPACITGCSVICSIIRPLCLYSCWRC